MEYFLIGQMLKEGLDVYIPMVDDDAIDAVVKKPDGTFTQIQIKARSRTCARKDCALFAAIPHEPRENYWFVFYSERLDIKWILSSEEFVEESHQNRSGKNRGKRSIWFNGFRKDPETGKKRPYPKERFDQYRADSFDRLLE